MRRRTIPKGAKYWWYFKTTILEQPRVRAEFSAAGPLDRAEFYEMVRRLASPIKLGPSFCRSTKPSWTRANEEWKMLRALYPYYQVLLSTESPLLLDDSGPGQGQGLFAAKSTRGEGALRGQPLGHPLQGQRGGLPRPRRPRLPLPLPPRPGGVLRPLRPTRSGQSPVCWTPLLLWTSAAQASQARSSAHPEPGHPDGGEETLQARQRARDQDRLLCH